VVLALTGGGPGTATELIGLHMYFKAFQELDMGQAMAIVIALLTINCLLVAFFARLGRTRNAE
jgi:ABC-type sugar transport system permease subunit